MKRVAVLTSGGDAPGMNAAIRAVVRRVSQLGHIQRGGARRRSPERQRHVGDLIVVEDPHGDQTPLGMVTDRDIVVEVLGRELDPDTVTVAEIMRKPVVIASEAEDVSLALDRMKGPWHV
jgi:CBS domain-containing protein